MERKELFQIGEVSKLFHISVGILRHYDKIGLLRPEYTDSDTGYRYYSTRQFECLNTIRYLRALDIPLEKIALFLHNRDTDSIHQLLQEQKEIVEKRQKELQAIERKITNRLNCLEDALNSSLDEIRTVKMPERRLAALKKQLLPKNYLDLEQSIRELERDEDSTAVFLGKVGVGFSEDRLKARKYQPYEIVFIILDEEDKFKGEMMRLPEETCVTIHFCGGHEKAPAYYDKLMDYIEENHYIIAGFSKEITMIDYGFTNDVSRFVTEIQIPVKKPLEDV